LEGKLRKKLFVEIVGRFCKELSGRRAQMNGRKFLKTVVTFSALIMVGGLVAVTSAQSASSTAAPPRSVGYTEGTGYAGYVVPDCQ
jgi:hypothetical protein